MNKGRMSDALLFPLMAVLTIVGLAGGLGVIFILFNETAVGHWGVIAVGITLVAGVPAIAALAERRVERT